MKPDSLASRIFAFLSSLKLGVVTLFVLSVVLAGATFLESMYGTQAVRVLVYGANWFYGLLFLLVLNVLCSALARLPWRKKHLGFLLTHFGIIVLLFGSFLTLRFGADGSLPVTEGSSSQQVLLPEMRLILVNKKDGSMEFFSVNARAFSKKGRLMVVDFSSKSRLVVDQFYPRAVQEETVVESPVTGLGVPAVHVEVFHDRARHIRDDRWLLGGKLGSRSEAKLDDLSISFRELQDSRQEKLFLSEKSEASVSSPGSRKGNIALEKDGKIYQVRLESALGKWTKVANGRFEIFIDKYFPHAVVQEGNLVSISQKPVNPAVKVRIRGKQGGEESHTLFALFPGFSSIHPSHGTKRGKDEEKRLGVSMRLLPPADSSSVQEGLKGPAVEFARSSDGRLMYRLTDDRDNLAGHGEVEVNKEYDFGSGGLHFRVVKFLDSGVARSVPRYIDKIEGSDSGLVSALHYYLEDDGDPNSGGASSGTWLMEGGRGFLTVGDTDIEVRYGRSSLVLPFEIYLEKFSIKMDPGTMRPASYESIVRVLDASREGKSRPTLIKMNEPLTYQRYTFYQASYQQGNRSPSVSIFSVNRDPGREVKYVGSLIMILGIFLTFFLNPYYFKWLLNGRRI